MLFGLGIVVSVIVTTVLKLIGLYILLLTSVVVAQLISERGSSMLLYFKPRASPI